MLTHEQGKSYREIGKTFNNYSTVHYVVKRQEETGNTVNKSRSGRPKALTNWERSEIIRQAVKKCFSIAQSSSSHVLTLSGKRVHPQTIRNVQNFTVEHQENNH